MKNFKFRRLGSSWVVAFISLQDSIFFLYEALDFDGGIVGNIVLGELFALSLGVALWLVLERNEA